MFIFCFERASQPSLHVNAFFNAATTSDHLRFSSRNTSWPRICPPTQSGLRHLKKQMNPSVLHCWSLFAKQDTCETNGWFDDRLIDPLQKLGKYQFLRCLTLVIHSPSRLKGLTRAIHSLLTFHKFPKLPASYSEYLPVPHPISSMVCCLRRVYQ